MLANGKAARSLGESVHDTSSEIYALPLTSLLLDISKLPIISKGSSPQIQTLMFISFPETTTLGMCKNITLLFHAYIYHPGSLGYGSTISKNLRSYYTQSFGHLNQRISLSNHTFIALDAPGLVDEDYQRHAKFKSFDDWTPIPGGPIDFIKETEECM